ncbi:hypothetical protein ROA7023_02383 [Roseisalinus antarcticus]|uniref:Uncharacterized protein n=1 Tax=Roseisalinus antarcticus TaxID=254357 RepID=A0A1Y5T0U2_9RHOB|nr:hypothetical protein ROA7023_02383 [Roseisalinus antarcticus]
MSKPPPARYRRTNWSSYNASPRIRVDNDTTWRAPHVGRPGRPQCFPMRPYNFTCPMPGIKFLGDGGWPTRKHGPQGRRQWRRVHLAMAPGHGRHQRRGGHPQLRRRQSRAVGPARPDSARRADRKGHRPSRQIAPQAPAGRWTAPTTRANVTGPSPTGKPPRSSRSKTTGVRGRKTVQPQRSATRTCAPPDSTDGRSGNAGPVPTPEAGSRRGCAA